MSDWQKHLKSTRAKNPNLSWNKVQQKASASYKKKESKSAPKRTRAKYNYDRSVAAQDRAMSCEFGELHDCTVVTLKQKCEIYKLPKSGNKDDLIKRIKKHMRKLRRAK